MSCSVRRPALAGLVCLSALALAAQPAAAGIFGSKKKPEPAPAAAPPPPPPPPAVAALPGPVLQAAGAYRIYMRKAAGVPVPQGGPEIERSLELAESSDPVSLTRGEVAYAAVVALGEPSFVEGVRAFASDPDQRRVIAQRLAADPSYVNSFAGAPAASADVAQALAADGLKVREAGRAMKQSAYTMQLQSWSKGEVPDRPGRLARAKTLAAVPMAATPEEMASLSGGDAAAPGQTRLIDASAPVAPASTPDKSTTSVIQHGLAIAALAALGETGDANDATVQTLLNDSSGVFCHNMAKLNLYQCLAVAKPYYEDAFCLGQHILIDTGQCVVQGAGVTPPPLIIDPRAAVAEAGGKAKTSRKVR